MLGHYLTIVKYHSQYVNFCENNNQKNVTRQKSQAMPARYGWNNSSVSNFQSALCSPEISSKIHVFTTSCYSEGDDSINAALHDANSIFMTAASASLCKIQRKGKRKTKHMKWYDTSLQELRRSLDFYSRSLSLYPFNRQLRCHCFKLNKKYNKLRHKKRRHYYGQFMNKLDSMQDSNPKLFWNLLKLSNQKILQIQTPALMLTPGIIISVIYMLPSQV